MVDLCDYEQSGHKLNYICPICEEIKDFELGIIRDCDECKIYICDDCSVIKYFRCGYPNNKPLQDRLNTIEKYNNMIDNDYLEDLKDNEEIDKNVIKRCENFQKHTYNTIKKTLYNEGKKLKKLSGKNKL